jgi:hypothetical protein
MNGRRFQASAAGYEHIKRQDFYASIFGGRLEMRCNTCRRDVEPWNDEQCVRDIEAKYGPDQLWTKEDARFSQHIRPEENLGSTSVVKRYYGYYCWNGCKFKPDMDLDAQKKSGRAGKLSGLIKLNCAFGKWRVNTGDNGQFIFLYMYV